MRILSSSSERLSSTARKDLGAFYTPPELTDFATEWAIRSSGDVVMDPGCGDGAFLMSAAKRLRALGAQTEQLASRIVGLDLNDDAVRTAREHLLSAGIRNPELRAGNFFAFRPTGGPNPIPAADAVVGNPPYVRYQLFRDENRALGLRAAASGGVVLPGLASSWAPYVVHSAAFLRPGGRLALVLPGELLHVGYASAIREFLLRSFADLTLITFEEKVFPGALEEVVVVLGTKGAGDGTLRVRRLHSLTDLGRPDAVLGGCRVCTMTAGQRWLTTILEQDSVTAAMDVIEKARFRTLGELGRVDIGVVTGANDFFVLDEKTVLEKKLPPSALLKVISKAAHVQGTRFTESDWKVLAYDGQPAHLLLADESALVGPVAKYVAEGEKRGLPSRYKCRTREPWYRVPYMRKPDLFLTYMSHISPRLVVNDARATHTNTVHGVHLTDPLLAEPLAAAFLNSATLLSAELEGRSYGGGVLKMEPGEAVRLRVPKLTSTLASALSELLPRIDDLVRKGRVNEASAAVDELVLKKISRAGIEKIRAMLSALRARRMTRGKTAKPAQK